MPGEHRHTDRAAIALGGFAIWLVWIRYFTAAAVGAVLAFAAIVLKLPLRYDALLALDGAVLVYNTAFWLYIRPGRAVGPGAPERVTPGLMHRQMTLDQVAIAGMLYLSGGVENPFVVVFLGHMVLAAVLLEPLRAFAQTGFALLLLWVLAGGEALGLLPSAPLPGFSTHEGPLHPLGLATAFSLGGLAIVYLTVHVMSELRRRRETILALQEDLSEANAALERSVAHLQRIDLMRQRLLAIATHDIRAPIATVESYVNLLRGGYVGELTEKQLEILNRCDRRLKGLRAFANDLLELARLERKGIVANLRPIDLAKALAPALEDASVLAGDRGITLETTIPGDLPLVLGAAPRLAQVAQNLLSNALKFTPPGGRVRCLVERAPDEVRVEVEDTGPGIDGEDLPHIFDEFYRARKGRETGAEGSGLGLFTVQAIVKAHGGRIGVESQVGEGSRFWFTVPTIPPPPDERDDRETHACAWPPFDDLTSVGSTR